MAFTSAPWDGGAVESGQEPGAFCRCCLIDLNEGGEKSKAACKLPVRSTPGGPYNTNAIAAAAAALAGARGGLSAPPEKKRGAARRLISLYGQMGKPAPDALKRIAGR